MILKLFSTPKMKLTSVKTTANNNKKPLSPSEHFFFQNGPCDEKLLKLEISL